MGGRSFVDVFPLALEQPVVAHHLPVSISAIAERGYRLHMVYGLLQETLEAQSENLFSLVIIERAKPPIIVVAFVDHPHRDMPVKHLVFLLPSALQLLILEGLVGSVEVEVSCIDGLLLGFHQSQAHLKNPIEEGSALVDGFA